MFKRIAYRGRRRCLPSRLTGTLVLVAVAAVYIAAGGMLGNDPLNWFGGAVMTIERVWFGGGCIMIGGILLGLLAAVRS